MIFALFQSLSTIDTSAIDMETDETEKETKEKEVEGEKSTENQSKGQCVCAQMRCVHWVEYFAVLLVWYPSFSSIFVFFFFFAD